MIRGGTTPGAAPWRSHQRGVSIVAALFLIVVLAAVGTFAVQIGTSQQHTTNLTVLEARAQAAAQAGIEWASTRARVGNTCTAGTRTLVLNEAALTGFTVRIIAPAPCFTTNRVNGVNRRVYTFTATATRGTYGTADFVSRSITQTVSNAPLP